MLTAEKKMMTVTSRQINTAANAIIKQFGEEAKALSKDWQRQAIDIACNHHGRTKIEADSTLAGVVKNL